MTRPFRFASAASLVALASMIAGCAAPQRHAASASKMNGEVGLATRALAAINANDFATAIGFAERAVENTPADPGFRALLGNAYFGAGRFASAEAAFKDSLSIFPAQPQLILKLALVEIAQGKNAEAVALLGDYQAALDPADFGLALALAGHAADAVPLLESAARVPGADARVRQNLALAYAFVGDWTNARTVAGQDVPANELDARLEQWMRLAKPTRPSDQIAALVGVTPALADPGQPARIAINRGETRHAQGAPVQAPAPQPQPQPQPQFAAFAPPPLPEYVAPAAPPEDPARIPAQIAELAPAPAFAPTPAIAVEAPVKTQLASITVKVPPVRAAVHAPVRRQGKSTAVVQLGAYGSRERVALAWDQLTKRYPTLRDYAPMTARFDSPKGTVYRLSIKGFTSQREAIARCALLKSRGGACFVRNVAGDAPIQLASR